MENEKTINGTVDEELNRELEAMKNLRLGSEEMKTAADTVKIMHDIRVNELNSKLEAKKAKYTIIGSITGAAATFGLTVYRSELARWILNAGIEFEKSDIWKSKTVGEFYKGIFGTIFRNR